jgi:hypothetical protein
MIIHLIGSTSAISEDISYLRAINSIIANTGNAIALDWFEAAHQRAIAQDTSPENWALTVDTSLEAIRRADIVIIEGTHSDYLQGYQTAIALEHKKPVLIISRNPNARSSYSGIRHRMLTVKEYKTEKDISRIVEQFIQDNTVTTKDLRFNMFIDRPIHNYLRSMSYETGKNKSEIIRDLINREIQKKD